MIFGVRGRYGGVIDIIGAPRGNRMELVSFWYV